MIGRTNANSNLVKDIDYTTSEDGSFTTISATDSDLLIIAVGMCPHYTSATNEIVATGYVSQTVSASSTGYTQVPECAILPILLPKGSSVTLANTVSSSRTSSVVKIYTLS